MTLMDKGIKTTVTCNALMSAFMFNDLAGKCQSTFLIQALSNLDIKTYLLMLRGYAHSVDKVQVLCEVGRMCWVENLPPPIGLNHCRQCCIDVQSLADQSPQNAECSVLTNPKSFSPKRKDVC
ncbi:hypothetical protein L6164_034606 [Bauhinia variegata]|uniref:Uncharacterized protein n=1 Tax=Bauhinia variegata TaxID=167791 RepID=A0ACB9KVH1_BAUVA|nr:hypothetical protein L6164_034606 [Bauhinia variegata]